MNRIEYWPHHYRYNNTYMNKMKCLSLGRNMKLQLSSVKNIKKMSKMNRTSLRIKSYLSEIMPVQKIKHKFD